MSRNHATTNTKTQYPHAVIDGHDVASVGDTLMWDGDLNLCSNCCLVGEVEVADVDYSSVDEEYYVSNARMQACCGHYWARGKDLHYVTPPPPPFDITKAPLPTQLVVHLEKKVAEDDITVAALKKALSEVKRLLVEEITGTGKQFRGLCTACMTDVHIVGGSLEHVDKRNCLTAAIMVTN